MPSRNSFRGQIGMVEKRSDRESIASEIDSATDDITLPFQSKFVPSDMRQLALVAHNHMKPAM